MTEPITARALIEMLRRNYIPKPEAPGGIFAPEIQAPSSSRRADLIWQGVTATSGHELIGHEVKVTRQDLCLELDDPTKSDPWMKYCDRWFLVIPDTALLDGLTLPPAWGVLTPPSGRRTRTMTTAVPAPKLKPHEQAPALRTLATWLHWQTHNATIRLERERDQYKRWFESARDEHEKCDRSAIGYNTEESVIQQILAGLGGVRNGDRIGPWDAHIDTEHVIAAVKDLAAARSEAQNLSAAADSTRRTLSGVRDRLDRVLGDAA